MAGDSYELLFQVKTQGEAALDQIESKIRGVDTAGKSAAGSVDNLTAQIQSAIAAINANTTAVNALTGALGNVSVSSKGAAAGLNSVALASSGVKGEAQAAAAALRELDGSFNMRSAGRFLTDVLGLGPALKTIFPLVSAIAFGEIVVSIGEKIHRLAEAYDPLSKAQKESLDTIQQLTRAYDDALQKANQLNFEHIELTQGRTARLKAEAEELERTSNTPGKRDQYLIEQLKQQIAEQQNILAHPGDAISAGSDTGTSLTANLEEAKKAAQTQLDTLNEQLTYATQIQKNHATEAANIRLGIEKEANDKRIAEAKRAAAEIAAAEKSAAGILRNSQTYELSGLERIIAKRQELLELYGKSAKAIGDINAAMNIEQGRELNKIFSNNRASLAEYLSGDGVANVGKRRNDEFSKNLKKQIESEAKELQGLMATAELYDRADENAVKRQADKALQVSSLLAGSGRGAQSLANDDAYKARVDLANQLFEIESRRIDRLEDEAEKEKALAQARLDAEDQLDKARTDHELKQLELQKKDLEEVHALAESFYDAIRRGGTGVQGFFSNQAQGIGRTLFANTLTEGYKAIGSPTGGGLIPGQIGSDGQLSTIGRILQGTPLGTNGKDGAQKSNTTALQRLTASVDRLSARIAGRAAASDNGDVVGSGEGSGPETWGLPNAGMPGDFGGEVASANNLINALGNTSVPGMIGVSFSDLGTMTQAALAASATTGGATLAAITGSGEGGAESWGLPTAGSSNNSSGEVSSATSFLRALSGTGSDFTGALARFAQPGQGVGAVMDAITGDSGDSDAQRAGVLVGAGTAAATGVMGVIQGIDQGGARGTLSAIGAGAGTVAAFDPDPVTKSILASVAAGASLIKGLLGDPRQNRALYEQRALRDDQYFAPPTINRTTDSYGNEVGYNFMGQSHSLPFQTFSEVMPYDKNYTMPFGSGVPNVWGEVPGQIIEPYTDPQNYDKDYSTPNGTNAGPQNSIIPPAQTIIIQAMDSQSFLEFANRNSSTIASMTSKEIKNGHPVGMAIQQAVFGT